MAEDRQDPYESTARWLEEAGRRRPADSSAGPAPAAKPEPPPAKPPRERAILGVGREIYMFAVMVAAYLNFYFMQVMQEIDSLPRMVVFYPLGQ